MNIGKWMYKFLANNEFISLLVNTLNDKPLKTQMQKNFN